MAQPCFKCQKTPPDYPMLGGDGETIPGLPPKVFCWSCFRVVYYLDDEEKVEDFDGCELLNLWGEKVRVMDATELCQNTSHELGKNNKRMVRGLLREKPSSCFSKKEIDYLCGLTGFASLESLKWDLLDKFPQLQTPDEVERRSQARKTAEKWLLLNNLKRRPTLINMLGRPGDPRLVFDVLEQVASFL